MSSENPVPNPTIQSEPGGSHIEPEFSNMPKANNVHKDVVVFAKIDDLLRKVNELAAKVPKTSDRMGFVAGICPEEHAESEDIIRKLQRVTLLSLVVCYMQRHTSGTLILI